jgi:dihydrofolate reductase
VKFGYDHGMRQIIYSATASLDGYIARKDGSVGWITKDPDIDFRARFSGFDVILLGRKTHEIALKMSEGGPNPFAGWDSFVFSRSKAPGKRHGVEYITTPPVEFVAALRRHPGKDLWLMGGGELAAEFLREDLVDGIRVAVCPVLLGEGIPMFGSGFPERLFRFASQRVYPKSGIVEINYERV